MIGTIVLENTTVDFNVPCCEDVKVFLDYIEEATGDSDSGFLQEYGIKDVLEIGDTVIIGNDYFLKGPNRWVEISRKGFFDAQNLKDKKTEFAAQVEFYDTIGDPSNN